MSSRAKKSAASGREQLHRLVDELPDQELGPAHRFLLYLRDFAKTSRAGAPTDVPEEDEELTPEAAARLEVRLEEAARGEGLTTEELRRELGL